MKNRPLVLDLVEWVAGQARSYDDVMAAWRTSCPQLTVWEDAVDAGLLRVDSHKDSGKLVCVTAAGREFLWTHDRGRSLPEVAADVE